VKVLEVYEDYKPLQESWYTEAVKAGKQVWTSVDSWDETPELIAATINSPIYDENNKPIGVIGVDLLLSKIGDFLRKIELSPSGKIFIVERDGLVIASSSSEQPFVLVNGKAERLNVLNSSDPLIRATARYLQQQFGNFEQIQTSQQLYFQSEGSSQYVRVTPWQDNYGLDWLVVVVVPESDFMEQIHANTHTTILLCLATLLIATLLGLLTSRWIARPIHRLNQASVAIASGDLNQTVEVKGVNELEILAKSFNQMAQQLQASFTALDKTNQELETRVRQRTAQLKKAVQAAMQAASQSAADKKAAEAASRAKSVFLANMSHELRTPLNAILGFTQIMERDPSVTLAQRENLGIISKSGEHLLSLINDVLDMSKIEAGRLVLDENDFDLDRLLNLIEEMFHLKAKSKEVDLLVERAPDVPQYIKTDEKKLRQVLINLLGNAIKFTERGHVALRVSSVISKNKGQRTKDKGEADAAPGTCVQGNVGQMTLQFEVEDTGKGIAPEEMEKLFQPFGQTESGRKFPQGTGLGLAISRQFVQLMGGEIGVRSQIGRGTKFTFTIQVKLGQTAELSDSPMRQQVIGIKPGQPEYRILVADDRPINRQLMLKLLEPIGFSVKEAENGRDAIAIWESWQPHLIWMDMQMPVMDGYEATQRIKSHPKGRATTVMALTASVFEDERALVLSAGCDDFVRKPFAAEVIFEKMAQYLGVSYVYKQSEVEEGSNSSFILDPSSLQIMPTEWINQLQQASARLDERQLAELIAQIPPESAPLAQALQNKVDNFDFDQIMNLAREAAIR
jgi:signal transduction histidine kinase/DNA-binding response OmpR family regulator